MISPFLIAKCGTVSSSLFVMLRSAPLASTSRMSSSSPIVTKMWRRVFPSLSVALMSCAEVDVRFRREIARFLCWCCNAKGMGNWPFESQSFKSAPKSRQTFTILMSFKVMFVNNCSCKSVCSQPRASVKYLAPTDPIFFTTVLKSEISESWTSSRSQSCSPSFWRVKLRRSGSFCWQTSVRSVCSLLRVVFSNLLSLVIIRSIWSKSFL